MLFQQNDHFIPSSSPRRWLPFSVEALQRALEWEALAARKCLQCFADISLPAFLPIGNQSEVWMTVNSAACLLFTFVGVKWVWRCATLHIPSLKQVWIWHWSVQENKSQKSLQKSGYKLLRAECIDTFDYILLVTYYVWRFLCSQCCSVYLGRVVIVKCGHILIVRLRDDATDFSWQQHFHFLQPNMQVSGQDLRRYGKKIELDIMKKHRNDTHEKWC